MKKLKRPTASSLSPAERERLYLIVEELSEAAKEACKILRFGYEGHHPVPSVYGYDTNRVRLEKELSDVYGIMRLMDFNGDISLTEVLRRSSGKIGSVRHYLRYKHKIPKGEP